MDKLSDHLFEVQPVVVEFMIGLDSQHGSIQRRFFDLQVECFSESQQRYIDFLSKHNYEFTDSVDKRDAGPQFMGVQIHNNLSDSLKGQ